MSYLKLVKSLFIQATWGNRQPDSPGCAVLYQVFGTPRNHPKSKPFHDHIMCFYWLLSSTWMAFAASLRQLSSTPRLDKKIWLRPEASKKSSLPKIEHSGSGTTKSHRKRRRTTTSLRSRLLTAADLVAPIRQASHCRS